MFFDVACLPICIPSILSLVFAPFLVSKGEGCFERNPGAGLGGEALPILAIVGEQTGLKDQSVRFVHDLDGGKRGSTIFSISGCFFDLFEEKFDGKVWVLCFGHKYIVLL